MTNILITGCSGFLAGHLIPRLQPYEGELYGLTEERDFRHPAMNVISCDLRDRRAVERVVSEVRPDLTFHLGAVANVGFSWSHRNETYEINFLGSSYLFEALARTVPGSRLLVMSSAELYQAADQHPLSEQSPLSATNPYAISKWAMEKAADLYTPEQLHIIKVRSFNFTGPGQNPRFVASDFARQIAQIEAGRQEPRIHVGNISAVRDFIDVRDAARFLEIAGREGQPGEVFNLCTGRPHTIADLLHILLSFSQMSIDVVQDPARVRPVDLPVLVGDPTYSRERLGFAPEYALEQTLLDLLNFWRS